MYWTIPPRKYCLCFCLLLGACSGGSNSGAGVSDADRPESSKDNPEVETPLVLNCSYSESDEAFKWIKVGGPLGGLGYNVRYSPDNQDIFYVTDVWSGLQKSNDGGSTWNSSNTGILARDGASGDAIPVFSLRIDPNDSDILWVGLQKGLGLFRSTDAGSTFTQKNTGMTLNPNPDLEGITIRHIEILPDPTPETTNDRVVYVMGEKPTERLGHEFARVQGFIYRSNDGGENFSLVREFDNLTRWMVVDSENTNNLLVTTGIFDREVYLGEIDNFDAADGLGVYRSTDAGSTWVQSNSGMSTSKSLYVGGAAVHPNNSQIIYVATGNNADADDRNVWGAVYKSLNGGMSWTDVSPKYNNNSIFYEDNFTAIAIAPSQPNIVYAGSEHAIYKSLNGGESWIRLNGERESNWGPVGVRAGFPIDMVVDKNNADTLYINNYGGGVFKSIDGAQTWESWSKGYTGADIHSVAVSENGCLSANGRSGAFRSENSGGDWSGMGFGIASFNEGSGVAYDPSDESGNTIFISDQFEGKILRSTNGGQDWNLVSGLPNGLGDVGNRHGVLPIEFAPQQPSRVYAGFMVAGHRTNPHNVDNIVESYGIFVSNDSGLSWNAKNSGLPTGTGARNISSIVVSKQNPDKLYLGLHKGGIFRSSDAGNSWVSANGILPDSESWNDVWDPSGNPIPRHSILSIAIDPVDDDVLYLGTNVHGLYKTTNGGTSWEKVLPEETMITNGPSDHAHVMGVVVDPTDSQKIYVGDWHSGVYYSENAGISWSYISGGSENNGLSTRSVNTLKISADGNYLYVGSQGEGVFRYKTSAEVSTFSYFSWVRNYLARD